MPAYELDRTYREDDGIALFREEVHRFARDELRPVAREIDQLPDEEYDRLAEPGSPFRDIMGTMKELGYHRALLPEEFGGDGLSSRERHVLMEELGWGAPGLAIALGVDMLPALLASMTFDPELQETFVEPYLADTDGQFQGCWGVTEPAHGSELVMAETALREGIDGDVAPPGVTIEQDGDEWVIDGAKASWISAGPVATHCALHAGMNPAEGNPGYLCFVPLDADGVTQGPPIRKLGQRECPQGELVFDGVRIPDRNVILSPENLHSDTGVFTMSRILCGTSSAMATVSTGLARAAFEEALTYARERKQGGRPICEHQSVKAKLYEMFEKVETARAYSRQLTEHLEGTDFLDVDTAELHRHALSTQVYCKRVAFEVAHEAVQVHGANGITMDYPVEKMFRDSRVKLIEDGTIEVLGLEAADGVIRHYEVD